MPTINKEITINAPLETVFDFLCKPSNLPQVWPSLVRIENEQPLPNGGYGFNWEYQMGGIFLRGSGKHTDIAPNCWIVCETKSAIDSTITWALRNTGENTGLFLIISYRVPVPVLGWLAEKAIVKMNESEADLLMANIQTRLEEEYRPIYENDIQLVKCSESIDPLDTMTRSYTHALHSMLNGDTTTTIQK